MGLTALENTMFFSCFKKKKGDGGREVRREAKINDLHQGNKTGVIFFVYLKIGGIIKHLNCFIAPYNFMGTARKLK